MNEPEVFAYNKISEQIEKVPESYLTHPTFGPNLKRVRTGKTRVRLSELGNTDQPAEVQATPATIPNASPADAEGTAKNGKED